MNTRILSTIFCVLLPLSGGAQDAQTLADIRQELGVLSGQLSALNDELSTNANGFDANTTGTFFDRIEGSENALQRLTAKVEELEFRIKRIVADGTNRIGDLEFRLVELEGGDISNLAQTPTLGGDAGNAQSGSGSDQDLSPVNELAAQEAADFERANAALEAGEFQSAAQQFETFNQTYPGGPMSIQADILRAKSLEAMGDTRSAARAYLDAFSADQNASTAPVALYHLAVSLGALGQKQEACVSMAEVVSRFPNTQEAAQATNQLKAMGCS